MPGQAPAFSGDQEPQWRYVHVSGLPAVPIRIVGQEEPWACSPGYPGRLSPSIAGRAMRAGSMHGAFVKPREVLNAIPFVAALGEAAAMDVMVFPHWRFPDTPPWLSLPRYLLQAQLSKGLPRSVEAVRAHAEHCTAVALEHRLQPRMRRSPSGRSQCLSQTAYNPLTGRVQRECTGLVRLGEIMEHGQLSDGHTRIPVAESVRQVSICTT